MYSRELMGILDNGSKKIGDNVDEPIHVTADETADDVKIYIRHNAGGIVKDFYEKFKIEKESRKFQWE